ncbi:glycosyltransferase [Sanguibacter suarezii]|uniref:glycosyltransferase n=1 Tax=Sanguibacter suarezii TaxID=60921 RepID=UPI0008342EA4|nr:glycosyltransferase [Sanguibacter suarezii]
MNFSVLLPVYAGDRPDFLRRAYDSVTTEQTLRPDEVVIVRDGPVGEALSALLDELGAGEVPTRIVALPVNGGLAAALEVGLAACAHEIVARMDADDISLPGRFAAQVPLVAGGLDIVGSAIQEFAEESEPGLVRCPPVGAEEIRRRARFVSPFNHPTVVYRKSAVRDAGGYQDLPLMEDYWLFARMLAAGAGAANIPEPLVLYRIGAGAYARRGGRGILRSELVFQRKMLSIGFLSWPQFLRNCAVRGVYRLVPEGIRKVGYRAFIRKGWK